MGKWIINLGGKPKRQVVLSLELEQKMNYGLKSWQTSQWIKYIEKVKILTGLDKF